MYTFLLRYYNIETDSEDTITIQIDSTPIDCTECEVYIYAMEKAYNWCKSHYVEFSALEFISC